MKTRNAFAVLFFFLSIVLGGCSEQPQPDFSRYISGYSSGVLRSSANISIYLAQPPTKGYQPGSKLPAHMLKISPAVKGELVLKEHNCVEFVPAERLRNGATYQVKFDLGALCDVPDAFRHFAFEFSTIPLSVVFETGELQTEEGKSSLRYRGVLHSSDEMENTQVEGLLTATYGGKQLQPEWSHQGNRHYFTIRNLQRGQQSQALTLRFDKQVKEGHTREIAVPGSKDFTVLHVKISDSEPPVITISMSENLDPRQQLDGLIRIGNQQGINYKVHGNEISVYLSASPEQPDIEVNLSKGIRSATGNVLPNDFIRTMRSNPAQPQLKLLGKGVIVPGDNQVLIPFSSIALKAVDLEIIQILKQNMNFFFQENTYDDHREIARTGRPVLLKTIDLAKAHPHIDLNRWNDFTINLAELVNLDKGAVYRFRLKFKKSYTTLSCADEAPDSEYGSQDWDNPHYYYSEYEYPNHYEWEERDNPCHVSYYTGSRFAARNIINTSLGLLAKRGADNSYFVSVSDLGTAEAVADCKVIFYNYQNQKIDSARTDKNGFATLHPQGKAFVLLAQKGEDKAWLRLADGNALSLSNFDVSGQHVQMGVKGFIYGERGVWRPGDELYLSLILEDKMHVLPDGHPIVAQLTDPNGRIMQTLKGSVSDKQNIHCFTFKTDESSQTGYWQAVFRVGGLTFTKSLRIETVKPNRLAIELDFPNEKVIGKGAGSSSVEVATRWLNGAPTAHQQAIAEVRLVNRNAGFAEFPDYTFSDRSKYFEPTGETLFEGTTNANGSFSFSIGKIKTDNAPGILNATFTTRVFENGGDFSISTQSIRYSPYTEYVGIRLPQSDDNWYSTREAVRLSGVTVSPTGAKTGNAPIRVRVFRLNWHWWWDSEDENLSSYVNRQYSKSIVDKTVTAVNGAFNVDLNISEYGRYYIQATAPSGHSTGIIAWFGSWADNASQEAATMLRIKTDKESYRVGETIRLTIPSSDKAVAIVSQENGKTISDIKRIETEAGSTTLEMKATSEMCPNTYIAVTLIQPYQLRENDRPIRLYGVTNVNVEDPQLQLHPEINMAKELRPGQEFKIEVSEKDGKAMNYTVAVVDEGLLSLTTFRTPSPFPAFYAREALGVKTWDFYDYIFGAYGARLDKAFAVGGDESLQELQEEKTNRFKPVVLFAGPFTLKAGKKQSHTFRMPEYIGEVRTMVIAATNGQYGSAAANATVNKPLMVSVALPRLFTPGDVIDIPVTVFAMKDNIREAQVTMTTDDKITLTGAATQSVRFTKPGEQVVYFRARINGETGVSTLRTEAVSGKESARVTEDVTIRIPNPRLTKVVEKEAKPGEEVSFDTPIAGYEPLSMLEISSIPPLNLEQRLQYLIDYPHGCAEQITSTAFPQLSLPVLLALNGEQQMAIEEHVRTVIQRLQSYQTTDGGFAYWPGGQYVSEWVTAYAVQFLTAARRQGYNVPQQMLQKAVNYLRQTANNWNADDIRSQRDQAYRLYVLALAGTPDLAAMNRLREGKTGYPLTRWLLAAAYALAGQENAARQLVNNLAADVAPYRETGGSFGSDTRDQALILQCMIALDRQQDAYRMLEKISRALASDRWYSTQETAFALHAAALYVEKYLGTQRGIRILVKTGGKQENIETDKTFWQVALSLHNGRATASVRNEGEGTLYVRQINSAAPLEAVSEKVMSGLAMTIRYTNTRGETVDLNRLQQGEDLTAEITVRNTGLTGTYEELALNYLLPSGFEIINQRLTGGNSWEGAEYVDIRDDRFYVYFSLAQGAAKTFTFRMNAAFRGEYLLPAVQCSAMYDNSIEAVLPGGRITIR